MKIWTRIALGIAFGLLTAAVTAGTSAAAVSNVAQPAAGAVVLHTDGGQGGEWPPGP